MTTAEYIEEFERAREWGKTNLKVEPQKIAWKLSENRFGSVTRLLNFINLVSLHPGLNSLLTKSTMGHSCYVSAMQLRPVACRLLQTEDVYLTMGYFNYKGRENFNFRDDILAWIKDPSSMDFENLKIHAWLTLNTGEIIDFALAFAIVNFKKEHGVGTPDEIRILTDNPFIGTVEQLGADRKVEYHPLIVGEKCAYEMGLAIPGP